MARRRGAKNISEEVMQIIMRRYGAGESPTEIARYLQLQRRTVSAVISRNGNKNPKSGRPPKVSPQLGRRVAREIRKNPGISSRSIVERLGLQITARTVRNCARAMGYQSYAASKKPALNKRQRDTRLKFARAHAHKPLSYWRKVLWSDESKIVCFRPPPNRIWRTREDSLRPPFVTGTKKSGESSVMVWGCCSAAGVGNLHHVDSKMNAAVYQQILEANLIQSKRKLRLPRDWVFMHDNDPKHTAKLTKAWLRMQGVVVMQWPPNSPDLNPIEHLWAHLKANWGGSGRINKRAQYELVEEAWHRIPPRVVRSLVDSMPRRIKAVLDARRGNTRY